VGLEHIEALAGGAARSAAQELAARHDARSYSPRYSLVGVLAEAFVDLKPNIDRALEYFTGWAESEAAAGRHDWVLQEAAALVELLGRAQRYGWHREVVRLGMAIEWSLAWGNRWTAWGKVLDSVLASAQASENAWAEAWAMHQIATRQYGLGNAPAAVSGLQRALELRERIGDQAGAEATRQNLRVANGPPPLLVRLSHLSLAVLAVMTVLLIGAAGVSGATILGGGGTGGGGDHDDAAGHALILSVVGKGAVVSGSGSIRCAKAECREEIHAGTHVLLRPEPQLGWQFSRWRGECKDRGACRILVDGDTRVTALFTRVADPRDVTVRVEGSGTVVSYPAGIACGGKAKECRATFKRSRDVKLTAAADRGHRFAGWSGGCQRNGRCNITGDERRVAVVARFDDGTSTPSEQKHKLQVLVHGTGTITSEPGGFESCAGPCTRSFPAGKVKLTANAPKGYQISWERACDDTEGDTCLLNLDGPLTVVVSFGRSAAPNPPPPPTTTTNTPPPSPKADLVIDRMYINGDNGWRIFAAVRNAGNASAPATVTQITPSGRPAVAIDTPKLVAGATTTVSAACDPYGTLADATGMADATNLVNEIHEDNNTDSVMGEGVNGTCRYP